MRVRLAVVVLLIASAAAQNSSEQYDVVISQNVMIPMRDGKRLAADIYRPARNGVAVEGKFPVIMERTPYNKERSRFWAFEAARNGYIGIAQDTRGRYHSEGRWRMLRDDVNDGYDTAKWIGAQPWCTCKIGTVGGSYPGGTQHALALSNAPFLAAMVPIDAAANTGYFGMRHNGAFELRFVNWILTYGARDGSQEALNNPGIKKTLEEAAEHVTEYVRGLPLRPHDPAQACSRL